jgi:hypothetical protein
MTIEFDHLFVFTTVNAPEVDEILAYGFTEGTSNIHSGQGTANRRIFFRNAMLEFLWIADEQEAKSPEIAPLHFWERSHSHQTEYSPFGIIFRFCAAKRSEQVQPLFTTWAYRPPYLPPHLQIDIASDTRPSEPFLAIIPFGGRPDAFPVDRAQPLNHACGAREITSVRITLPSDQPLSTAAAAVENAGLVQFSVGNEHSAELEFDLGIQKRKVDFRPGLPLCLRW